VGTRRREFQTEKRHQNRLPGQKMSSEESKKLEGTRKGGPDKKKVTCIWQKKCRKKTVSRVAFSRVKPPKTQRSIQKTDSPPKEKGQLGGGKGRKAARRKLGHSFTAVHKENLSVHMKLR